MGKKNIILIGAGGHSKSCIDVIEQENKFQIIGLIDIKEKIGEKVLGYDIIDCDENLLKYINPKTYFLITIGQIESPQKRIELFQILENATANIATIISPRAYISKHSKVNQGTVIMHDVIINANATVGENCIINTKALIEHDAIIGDNCHISTGAIVNGKAIIEKGSFVGSNSVIVHNKIVNENSFIRAGSLVK